MRRLLDEDPAYPPLPNTRLNEEALKLGGLRSDQNDRKSGNPGNSLRNDHRSSLNVFERKVDGLGIRLQLGAIFRQGAGCAMLQFLEVETLVRPGRPNPDRKVSEP